VLARRLLTLLLCAGVVVLWQRPRGGTPSITRGQNVVMRQLGVIGTEAAPDATAFQEYLRLFATGLSESHCLAIRVLFRGALDDAI
jgi:hypothetical protein